MGRFSEEPPMLSEFHLDIIEMALVNKPENKLPNQIDGL